MNTSKSLVVWAQLMYPIQTKWKHESNRKTYVANSKSLRNTYRNDAFSTRQIQEREKERKQERNKEILTEKELRKGGREGRVW